MIPEMLIELGVLEAGGHSKMILASNNIGLSQSRGSVFFLNGYGK